MDFVGIFKEIYDFFSFIDIAIGVSIAAVGYALKYGLVSPKEASDLQSKLEDVAEVLDKLPAPNSEIIKKAEEVVKNKETVEFLKSRLK